MEEAGFYLDEAGLAMALMVFSILLGLAASHTGGPVSQWSPQAA